MKRAQIRVKTLLLDDDFLIGQIRLAWADDFGTKTWRWQYSPDGDVGGVWSWVPWFFPKVETYDWDTVKKGALDDWCMVLTRTTHQGSVNNGTYAILYSWSGAKKRTGPDQPWFHYVQVDSGSEKAVSQALGAKGLKEPARSQGEGKMFGSGLGLFAAKKPTIFNKMTYKTEPWFLPPSGAHIISWTSEPWSALSDPFSKDEQLYILYKREGYINDDQGDKDKIPPGYNTNVMPDPGPKKIPAPKPYVPPASPPPVSAGSGGKK